MNLSLKRRSFLRSAAAASALAGLGDFTFFADISRDRMSAARKTLAYLKANPKPQEFIRAARRWVFLKGKDSHDYKFSSAVLEDYQHVSPVGRDRYLAASVFWLRGSGEPDNALVRRTREALKA